MSKDNTKKNLTKELFKNYAGMVAMIGTLVLFLGIVFFVFKVACHLFTWSWDNFWTEKNTVMVYWLLGFWLFFVVVMLVSLLMGIVLKVSSTWYKKMTKLNQIVSSVKKYFSKVFDKILAPLLGFGIVCAIIYYAFGPILYGWVSPLIHKKHPLNCETGQQNVLYFYNPLFSDTNGTETAYTCCDVEDTKPADVVSRIVEDKNGKPMKQNGKWVEQYVIIGANSSGKCCPKGTQGMRYITFDNKIYTTCCPIGTSADHTGKCCENAMNLPTMSNALKPAVCCPKETKLIDSKGQCCALGTHYVPYVKASDFWGLGESVEESLNHSESYFKLREHRYGKQFSRMLTLEEIYEKQKNYREGDYLYELPELLFACCSKEQKEADSHGNCCQVDEHAVYYMRRDKVLSKCCPKQFDTIDKKGNCVLSGE